MSLEELVFYVTSKDGEKKTVSIIIAPNGVTILTEEEDTDLTIHELHYAVSVAFMYLGAYLKEIPVTREFVLEKGFQLYKTFQERYEGMKSIGEMRPEEFDEFMKKYNGRNK